jgi:hypothetical protein
MFFLRRQNQKAICLFQFRKLGKGMSKTARFSPIFQTLFVTYFSVDSFRHFSPFEMSVRLFLRWAWKFWLLSFQFIGLQSVDIHP